MISSVGGEAVSTELRPLLLAAYELLARPSAPPSDVARAIERLLVFLSSPAGRTNANCVAADYFFALDDGWGDVSWDHLPAELGDVIVDLGSALHDTISAPEVASNFDCTPEQLLVKLRASGHLEGEGR